MAKNRLSHLGGDSMDGWFKVGVVFAGVQALAAIVTVIEFFGVTSQTLPKMDARFYIPSAIIGVLAVFTWVALYLSYRAVSQNRVNVGRTTNASADGSRGRAHTETGSS